MSDLHYIIIIIIIIKIGIELSLPARRLSAVRDVVRDALWEISTSHWMRLARNLHNRGILMFFDGGSEMLV